MVRAGDLGLILRMLVSTLVVLGLLMAFARMARKGKLNGLLSRVGGSSAGGKTEGLRVLERQALSRESMLVVVEFAGEEILVAVGTSGGNVISRREAKSPKPAGFQDAMREARSDTDAEDALARTLSTGGSLVERLRAATSRREVQK